MLYTAAVCVYSALQMFTGFTGRSKGFSAISAGKNIYRLQGNPIVIIAFSLQLL